LHALWQRTQLTAVFVTHSIPEAVYLSTRIVVMSPRPGRIVEVIDCDLPCGDDGLRDLAVRESPAFVAVARRVREALHVGHSYD
jgi:NitT/TauT family transport system ATP-binding protein